MDAHDHKSFVTLVFGIDRHPTFGTGSKLLHPESPFVTICNAMSAMLLIYVIVIVQFEVGFYWHLGLCDEGETDVLANFDIFVDVWFLIEMMLAFFTGIFVDGNYVDDWSAVALHYFQGWFLFDAITSVPETIIESALRTQVCSSEGSLGNGAGLTRSQHRVIQLLHVLRPLRIFRLLRVIHVEEKLVRLRESMQTIDWLQSLVNKVRAS